MKEPQQTPGNLWIAKTIFDLGGVEFGNFTIGRSTVGSPVYINARVLVSDPMALKRIADILHEEVLTRLERRHEGFSRFDLVAGVPFGGLHLATAYSLRAEAPMIYVHPDRAKRNGRRIEGRFKLGQRVLIIDDLVTSGGSIVETAQVLHDEGLEVKDAIVLIEREEHAHERLRQHGINLASLLNLRAMLNHYMAANVISDEWFRKSMAYLDRKRAP